jgi:hypothetical protein
MDLTKLKIIWREWDEVPSHDGFGHGVQFHDTTIKNRDESLVGFLYGFEWYHGLSNEAVIYCIKPNARTPQTVLSSMKKRVEEILAVREIPMEQITSRILAWVNG